LVHELPTANNPWHFRHLTDGQDGLCISCCTLALLRLPLFTTLGGSGGKITNYFFAGINGAPPIYTMSQGSTLCATLFANWQPTTLNFGHPNWSGEAGDEGTPSQLNGLTHLPRWVWLGKLETGICVLCASNAGRIRECNIESPGKNEDENWIDPHALFRRDKDELKLVRSIDPTESEFVMNSQWPSIHAACCDGAQAHIGESPHWLVAFTSADASKIDVTESTIYTIPPTAQGGRDKSILAGWRKGVRLPTRAETKKRPITSSFRPHVEHIVSKRAEKLIQGGEEGWKQAAAEWENPLHTAARSLAPDYTAESLLRRAEIERAVPRWNEPKPEDEKPKRGNKRK
jgi:hypothetical protein